jgi:hypothetical protein
LDQRNKTIINSDTQAKCTALYCTALHCDTLLWLHKSKIPEITNTQGIQHYPGHCPGLCTGHYTLVLHRALHTTHYSTTKGTHLGGGHYPGHHCVTRVPGGISFSLLYCIRLDLTALPCVPLDSVNCSTGSRPRDRTPVEQTQLKCFSSFNVSPPLFYNGPATRRILGRYKKYLHQDLYWKIHINFYGFLSHPKANIETKV